MATKRSGQHGFEFVHCDDLSVLPEGARPFEVNLHGGFAVDDEGDGYIYYGMPGYGLMRIHPDLSGQEVIELPSDLKPINFHSTKIVEFDGKRRIVLPANQDAKVVVVGLDGSLDYVLSRPEFEAYQDEASAFCPTDTAAIGDRLYVADGYGSNYISTADLPTGRWTGCFAGPAESPTEPGRFGTAHGLNVIPGGHHHHHLSIADRPHARMQIFNAEGAFQHSHAMPEGSFPCGVDFYAEGGRHVALIASLNDPIKGRPAPIYIVDAESYNVVSTIRPKEELGIELADHIHNVVWYPYNGDLYLICQAWNPGHYFVLMREPV